MDVYYFNYLFAFFYIVVFSFGANRFNQTMAKIKSLDKLTIHPQANLEMINRDKELLRKVIRRRKIIIYSIFTVVLIVQISIVLIRPYYGINRYIPFIFWIGFNLLIQLFYFFDGGKVIPDGAYRNMDF